MKKLTKYDVCSICTDYEWFRLLRYKWCKQYKYDCATCDMIFCSRKEVAEAIERKIEY
jgi:hypothetical protein